MFKFFKFSKLLIKGKLWVLAWSEPMSFYRSVRYYDIAWDYNSYNSRWRQFLYISLYDSRWRLRYFLFSWCYTTNHKRIAVNYFWFVLLAGITGMVLATLIRLEMAYPGIGVLAGDATQYLSIVTAHGIVMVFFMAIPLLFGFLGNFLLPTQLGVHDVAFPRMNSAAFWLLPASLLALAQLVCTDRRYQRMNCFNIIELQDMLRHEYWSDYSQTHNNLQSASFHTFSSYRRGQLHSFWDLGDTNYQIRQLDTISTPDYEFIKTLLWHKFTAYNFIFYPFKENQSSSFILTNFYHQIYSRFVQIEHYNTPYRLKTGDYCQEAVYTNLFTDLLPSISFKSILGLHSLWFSSSTFFSFVKNSPVYDLINYTSSNLNSVHDLQIKFPWLLKPSNFFFWAFERTLINSFPYLMYFDYTLYVKNNNWIFSQIFSQIKQHRFLNDFRQLLITREGWRCRLLASRHQRSLYKRYVNEGDIIWIIEKNAKDILPGWALITPFSARTRYTLYGKTDVGIAIVAITLIASMITSTNFLMTYRYLSTLNNRKMRDARSFFTESVITASWMMLMANPMLILGLFMLFLDRHWHTSFFDYSGGGDTILFQHMFWFFGHPEVYIIIMPCFGITNTLLSFYLRKRISARASLLYSLYTIAFLGFFVWGHHMYMVGLSHTTRMLYSTLTVMISVPAATKIMHWLVTIANSSVHFELPFILTLLFIYYFVTGGISGMNVAHTGMSILFHDTFYVIGHFHVMFAGSLMFASFAAFYFYLPSVFGVRYSRFFSYCHVFYYTFGQTFTIAPMIWLGYIGMPRRVLDYPSAMGGWHSIISSAHIITVSGVFSFVLMLLESLRKQHGYAIKTFGVGRYNTRLNFYTCERVRNRYWLSKHYPMFNVRIRTYSKNSFKTAFNLEPLESTLCYYTLSQRMRLKLLRSSKLGRDGDYWTIGHYPTTEFWPKTEIPEFYKKI